MSTRTILVDIRRIFDIDSIITTRKQTFKIIDRITKLETHHTSTMSSFFDIFTGKGSTPRESAVEIQKTTADTSTAPVIQQPPVPPVPYGTDDLDSFLDDEENDFIGDESTEFDNPDDPSRSEKLVEFRQNEALRKQLESTIQESIKQAIFCLPIDQLESFDAFLVEQQKQFNSIFLSQRVNQQFQKYVFNRMKREMKPFENLTKEEIEVIMKSDQSIQPFEDEYNQNHSRESRLSSVSLLVSPPQKREAFFIFCLENVKCVNKEYNQADYHVSMNVEWIIGLPHNKAKHDKDLEEDDEDDDEAERKFRAEQRRKQERDYPSFINVYCYYNGDNEGQGIYSWECLNFTQEFPDYYPAVKLLLYENYQKLFDVLSMTSEETSQLFTFLFRTSFWNDI